MNTKKYCPACAAGLTEKYVDGRTRLFCFRCERPVYENPTPATAAVVINKQDEILLVKRNVDPQKGEWCLPGGFVEIDETPEQGCVRELREETGLDAETDRLVGVYLSLNPYYKSVLIIGFTMKNAAGRIEAGDDSDEAAYFKLERMPPLAFKTHRSIFQKVLENRQSRRFPLKGQENFGAYVITSGDHVEIARAACAGGARILQYRNKVSGRKEVLQTARRIRRITSESNTLFIINDYIDIALLVGADGVHLGQDDVPIAEARTLVPPGFIIGCSTHSLAQAVEAEKDGADYIGSGPVFATPTKESYPPIGMECVKQVLETVKIPVVVIGGLNLDNLSRLRQVGAKNFAMVRAFQRDTAEVVTRINSGL
ncbi:MAG: thiamine phosphate synthase [Candidatus Aminicenantes bacterium]|nr:thiamine phosphate synthase [Candidatus Aminicenantes bacterium]